MEADYELLRSERRSFFCPNNLWKELQKKTGDNISISTYIKQAIVEKMIKEEFEKKDYFKQLLVPELP
ncbi:MAG: hypothetical protein ABH879_01600 [archaeon]